MCDQNINFINWGVKWLTGNESVRGWKVTGHKILYPFQPYTLVIPRSFAFLNKELPVQGILLLYIFRSL